MEEMGDENTTVTEKSFDMVETYEDVGDFFDGAIGPMASFETETNIDDIEIPEKQINATYCAMELLGDLQDMMPTELTFDLTVVEFIYCHKLC